MKALWIGGALVCAACGEPAMTPLAAPSVADPDPAPPPAVDETEPELRRAIDHMLARVSKKRELAAKWVVQGRLLDRSEVVGMIMAKNEKELPKGVVDAQGELLRAFGLIPAGYDFSGGIYDLIDDNLAGFYDQDTKKMYLIDDLPKAGADDTLAHELVHALQDQHFNLGAMLEYRPGEADAITAAHALAEGDAMATMMDVTIGDSFKVTPGELGTLMSASVSFASGVATPRVLQAALVAPYVDGFRFVQGLRQRGGWGAVDVAYARLPATTEQLLHLDKYDAAEPMILVRPPAFGAGWTQSDADVLGEQGLRMIFEQWGTHKAAAAAAAGWGGDRFVVAHRVSGAGTEWSARWVIHFDSEADAQEAEALMVKQHPNDCSDRADLGPFAYRRAGAVLAMVGGPFVKTKGGGLAASATCGDAAGALSQALAP